MTESWLPAPNSDGLYSVSSYGRVRTEGAGRGRSPGRILKASPGVNGYPVVSLWKSNKPVQKYVHRLVCEAFHGPAPDGKPYALHGDGDRENNLASNLRWGSAKENSEDSILHGTMRNGRSDKTHCPQGHPYDEDNTYYYPQGVGRGCKTCRVIRTQEWRARNKETKTA